jgi:uncharacterized membrane protein YecN with MAPEG domain
MGRIPNPWVSLVLLMVVPAILMSPSGPRRFTSRPGAYAIWFLLIVIALAALLRGPWFSNDPLSISALALFLTPLIQAAAFALSYAGFVLLAGRVPVNFNEARYGRNSDGGRHIPDAIFWGVILLTIIVGACLACAALGVEFPHRHRTAPPIG